MFTECFPKLYVSSSLAPLPRPYPNLNNGFGFSPAFSSSSSLEFLYSCFFGYAFSFFSSSWGFWRLGDRVSF